MLIECEDLWKLFGAQAERALEAARKGASRDALMAEYEAVLAVAGVSFSVAEGEIFVVMGLSGSGKSTLVRHLNRLVEPTAGKVIIEGRDVSAMDDSELRRLRSQTIGMVFQHVALLPHRTVVDNVAFGLELRGVPVADRRGQAERALAKVELDGWGERRPDELSGGMQQRVGLARALVSDPPILLMDEPFSALDPLIRRQLQDEFLRLSRELGKTTVFITHDLDEALRLGDRVAILRDGALVQCGTPAEIVTTPADSYVREFVEGASSMVAMNAGSLLDIVNGGEPADEASVDGQEIAAEASLADLLQRAASSDRPLVVTEDGRSLGVLTRTQVLGLLGERFDDRHRAPSE